MTQTRPVATRKSWRKIEQGTKYHGAMMVRRLTSTKWQQTPKYRIRHKDARKISMLQHHSLEVRIRNTNKSKSLSSIKRQSGKGNEQHMKSNSRSIQWNEGAGIIT